MEEKLHKILKKKLHNSKKMSESKKKLIIVL